MTSGSITWSFTYNADGLRTSKTNGTMTYTYVYNGSSYTRDDDGNIISVKDLQGQITTYEYQNKNPIKSSEQ